MADSTTVFVKGKIYWPKILGAPRLNYEGDGKEWTYEFEPEDTTFLKEHKLLDRLKDKYEDRKPYLNLKKPEYTKDGEKNEPIRVYNEDNELWDPARLLGNGTEVDAKLRIVDYGKGKKQGIYTTALRVTKHVSYVSNEFSGMDGESEKPTKVKGGKSPAKKSAADYLDDLDDEIPF